MVIYFASANNAEKYTTPTDCVTILTEDVKNNFDKYTQVCEILHDSGLLTTVVIEPLLKTLAILMSADIRNKNYHRIMMRMLTLHPLRTIVPLGNRKNKDACLTLQDKLISMVVQPHHRRELQDRRIAVDVLCELPANN